MAKVPYTKTSLSYSAQLQQLINRGLIVENKTKATHLLQHLSYYRLSGYWYPFLKEPKEAHIFKENSKFQTVFHLYCFDRELRKFLMAELEKLEIAMRAQMSYVMSNNHGSFWYLDDTLFTDRKTFTETKAKIISEYKRSQEVFIRSFQRKYSDPLPPSWMILEISSFGTLSKLYNNLKPGLSKRDIADHFGLDDGTLQSWLHSFAYLRNVCAHHSRLWNKQLKISPSIPLSPSNTFIKTVTRPNPIPGGRPILNNNRTYFLLCMIVYLLNTVNPKHTTKRRLYRLLKKYPMVDVRAMGFPQNWELEEFWKWDEVVKRERWYIKSYIFIRNHFLKLFKKIVT